MVEATEINNSFASVPSHEVSFYLSVTHDSYLGQRKY